MFQDPSRRKDGMNLKETEQFKFKSPKLVILVPFVSCFYVYGVFTLYRRLWDLHVSAWWEHSWWRCCTGQTLSSWTVFWLHPQERPRLLCRSQRRRQRWSGTADCLKGKRRWVISFYNSWCLYLDVKEISFWNQFSSAAHLSSGRTSGWALWSCRRSPALHSLQWRYGWCSAYNLEERRGLSSKPDEGLFLRICEGFWGFWSGTSPKAPHSLVSGNRLVGVQRAVVPPPAVSQSHLGLETHLHHICRLRKGHGHGSCGAARHEPGDNPSACEAACLLVRSRQTEGCGLVNATQWNSLSVPRV